jgi:hypothetical protein
VEVAVECRGTGRAGYLPVTLDFTIGHTSYTAMAVRTVTQKALVLKMLMTAPTLRPARARGEWGQKEGF